MDGNRFSFNATVWEHVGPSSWYFVSLPESDADDIDEAFYAQVRARDYAGLTEREQLCAEFAELFATDHLSIDDAVYDDLRRYFTEDELVTIAEFYKSPTGQKFAEIGLEQALDEIYRHASVYVQASRHEGFGMSVAEAQSRIDAREFAEWIAYRSISPFTRDRWDMLAASISFGAQSSLSSLPGKDLMKCGRGMRTLSIQIR